MDDGFVIPGNKSSPTPHHAYGQAHNDTIVESMISACSVFRAPQAKSHSNLLSTKCKLMFLSHFGKEEKKVGGNGEREHGGHSLVFLLLHCLTLFKHL